LLLAIAWETMPVSFGDDAPEPDSVLAAFGLGGSVTAVTVVGGAWSNRVYRLDTGAGSFAVKEMRNPWADPGWKRWLAEAWSFEQRALAAGVSAPLPVANPVDGGCLAWVQRRTGASRAAVRLHRWAEGRPAGLGPVAPAIAVWAGQTLATLHGLRVRAGDRSVFPVPSTDTAHRWPELADAAHRAGATWAGPVRGVGDR